MDSSEFLKIQKMHREALNFGKRKEASQLPKEEEEKTQPVQKEHKLSSVSSPENEISTSAQSQIQNVNLGKEVSEKEVKIDLPDIHTELQIESIQTMNQKTKTGLIKQIKNSPELNGKNELKGLLDYYLFVLSLDREDPEETAVNNTSLDVMKCRAILKSKIVAQIEYSRTLLDTAETQYVYENLENLVKGCFYQDREEMPEEEIAVPDAQEKWDQFTRESGEMIRQIDSNILFDKGDRLDRKIELYRTYEERVRVLSEGFGSSQAQMMQIQYAYQIQKLESELAEFYKQRSSVRLALKAETDHLSENSPNYANKKRALDDHIKDYRNQYSTPFKQDLFALDQKKEEEKNREADKTLDLEQVQAVRRLDAWMLDHAKDDYKDKSFMAQVLGCTVRERLAMYLCIESEEYEPDYAELLFSQANYLPDEEKIKKEMFGHSLFRRAGWKRVHWSKMRKAYEFVSKKSGDIETLADIAVDEQADAEKSQREFATIDAQQTKEIGDSLQNEATDRTQIEEASRFAGDQLHQKVSDTGEAIVRLLQQIRNSDGDSILEVRELIAETKLLRALVDKEEKEAKDKGFQKHWSRYKTTVSAFDLINTTYGDVSTIATALRKFDVFGNNQVGEDQPIVEDTATGKAVDGTEFVAMYGKAAINLLKFVNSTGNMINDWKLSSKSANTKAVIDTIQSGIGLYSSIETAYSTTKEHGTWAGGFKNSRRAAAKAMKKRLDQGLSASEINFSKMSTYIQVIGSGLTVGSAVIDYYNIDRSRRAASTIKEQVRNRQKENGRVDDNYRDKTYKNSLANLTKRLNVRKGITATTQIVSNATGYLKYILSTSWVGIITGGITAGIGYLSKGLDLYLKKRSDYKTVDDFLDLDKMIAEYRDNNHDADVNINDSSFRKTFRKRAMLQLGFANTKTFFAHVASRLAGMIHDALEHANDHREAQAAVGNLVTIVKSMGLGVNFAKGIVPSADKIAAKLSQ